MKHVKRHAKKPEAYWANTAPLRATREWREHSIISLRRQDTLVAELKLVVEPLSRQTLKTKAKQRYLLDTLMMYGDFRPQLMQRGGAVAANNPQIKSKPSGLGYAVF